MERLTYTEQLVLDVLIALMWCWVMLEYVFPRSFWEWIDPRSITDTPEEVA